jgi:peptidoglycan hydrolase-like protein with peptidoglycan-binding domain
MSDGSTSNASLSVPAQVQQELARDGYYQGPIDGILGPATQAAIAAYQRDNGLRVTGTINSHLLDALDLD